MPKRTRDYRETLLKDLQNPTEAASYVNAALEESEEMFLRALRDVAEASQMARVAEAAGIARESIYRMLTDKGNPTYSSLVGILRAVGLKVAIEPEEAQTPKSCCQNSENAQRMAGGLKQAHADQANRSGTRNFSDLAAATLVHRKGMGTARVSGIIGPPSAGFSQLSADR